MIPAGAKVYVATRPVDFRKGPDGLAALVRDTGADPFSGALYVFRAKRADRVKIVWWDGALPVRQAPGRGQVPLAARGERSDPPCSAAADGAGGGHGLDARAG